jgi:hypothetical protein
MYCRQRRSHRLARSRRPAAPCRCRPRGHAGGDPVWPAGQRDTGEQPCRPGAARDHPRSSCGTRATWCTGGWPVTGTAGLTGRPTARTRRRRTRGGQRRGRGGDLRPAGRSPQLGSSAPGLRAGTPEPPGRLPLHGLPDPGPPPPDRAGVAAQAPGVLPPLGAVGGDGAVADGRDRQPVPGRRPRVQGHHHRDR